MQTCPKISIITPSFNQATYLERTIKSVLDQNYPNLEYIIIDGGSTDSSIDIIKKYESKITCWVSEPDHGQASAINKGLRIASGDWVAWQNSDDIYYPKAFWKIAKTATRHPDADLIIGDMMIIDDHDRHLRDVRYVAPSHVGLLAEGMVMVNQAAFWRRRVHREIGWLDESLQCSFDYEWFLRLTEKFQGVHVNRVLGGFRLHGASKTHNWVRLFGEENRKILHQRELPSWKVRIYQLRRLALMLGQGKIGYALRGIIRRIKGRGGLY
jgi:glycosyltransferase involved in cell wall biosynthesis